MTDQQIEEVYALICKYHEQFLKGHGVKMPRLKDKKGFCKKALVLVYLAQGYPDTGIVTKTELTDFMRQYDPDTDDVQQARHLSQQDGFYIISSKRKDAEALALKMPPKSYKLLSLEKHYPKFTKQRRDYLEDGDFFENLKKEYGCRCATCGSEEGKPNLRYPNIITTLHMGHMDPSKPLKKGNIIPQCETCNRPDQNYWIYDKKGRVVGIADESIVSRCSIPLKKKIYLLLKKELGE